MDRRLELQGILEEILGSRNVYFQPPSSIRLKYPAIVYTRKSIDNTRAGDVSYKMETEYEAVVIDQDPDSEIVYKLSLLPYCKHTAHYETDNLNHDAFRIYY